MQVPESLTKLTWRIETHEPETLHDLTIHTAKPSEDFDSTLGRTGCDVREARRLRPAPRSAPRNTRGNNLGMATQSHVSA
jgi:hypothetical protein